MSKPDRFPTLTGVLSPAATVTRRSVRHRGLRVHVRPVHACSVRDLPPGVKCGRDGSVDHHMEMGKKLLAAGQLADALSHFHAAVGERR